MENINNFLQNCKMRCPFGVKRTKNAGVAIPPHPRNALAGLKKRGSLSWQQSGFCLYKFTVFVPPTSKGTLSSLFRLKSLACRGKCCSRFLGSRQQIYTNATVLLLLVCYKTKHSDKLRFLKRRSRLTKSCPHHIPLRVDTI